MNSLFSKSFLSLFIIFLSAHDPLCCSAFSLSSDSSNILGRNYDWYFGNCLIMVNKRNISKKVFLCNNSIFSRRLIKNVKMDIEPEIIPEDSIVLSWISKYGSITFNQYGRGFPLEGMNEAGLVITLLQTSDTHYPIPDSRSPVDIFTWIQYQLDNCASINDVIKTNNKIRIHSASIPVHFILSDRSGICSVIEFIGDTLTSFSDTSLPYTVLTNTLYLQSLKYYQLHWDGNIPNKKSSFHRFSVIADMQERQNGRPDDTYAFEILQSVSRNPNGLLCFFLRLFQKEILAMYTQWSVVYDIKNQKIHFKSLLNSDVKSLSLLDFDFSCSKPCLILDINTRKKGNVSQYFFPFSIQSNRVLIEKSFSRLNKKFYFYKNVSYTALNSLVNHPQYFLCK